MIKKSFWKQYDSSFLATYAIAATVHTTPEECYRYNFRRKALWYEMENVQCRFKYDFDNMHKT